MNLISFVMQTLKKTLKFQVTKDFESYLNNYPWKLWDRQI